MNKKIFVIITTSKYINYASKRNKIIKFVRKIMIIVSNIVTLLIMKIEKVILISIKEIPNCIFLIILEI